MSIHLYDAPLLSPNPSNSASSISHHKQPHFFFWRWQKRCHIYNLILEGQLGLGMAEWLPTTTHSRPMCRQAMLLPATFCWRGDVYEVTRHFSFWYGTSSEQPSSVILTLALLKWSLLKDVSTFGMKSLALSLLNAVLLDWGSYNYF